MGSWVGGPPSLLLLQGFTIFALLGGVVGQIKQKAWVKPTAQDESALVAAVEKIETEK